MKDYGNVKLMKWFPSVPVLLFSVAMMIAFSTCGGNEKFSISGNVRIGGVGLPGVTIELSGDASDTTQTDASGHYIFRDVEEGEYRVTPQPGDNNYVFTPTDSKVYLFGLDATGFSFSVTDQGRVVAGGSHTVSIRKSDGTVWAWGNNTSGQLGNGSTGNSPNPVQVVGLPPGVVTAIAAGGAHTVALVTDGEVTTVWAWGSNSDGQLGNETSDNNPHPTPAQVILPEGTNVTAIAAGDAFTVALTDDGTVYAWGSNSNGQLGNEPSDNNPHPTPAQVTDFSGVTAIAAGGAFTVALKNDRTVWTWGANNYGQLGHGGTTDKNKPAQVGNLSDVRAIAAGSDFTLALKKEGSVRAWGRNDYGQLGHGDVTTKKETPVDVKKLSDVIAIAAGYVHAVAVKSDGTAWAWGDNSSGQLGNESTDTSPIPVQVVGLTVQGVSGPIAVSAGDQDTFAVQNDETIWGWGINSSGQLGNGTTDSSSVPVMVSAF